MSFTADKRHQFDREEFYGDFAINLGWQQNFSRSRLSSYFLDSTGKMTVGANGFAEVRASDLGLSTSFTGCATLCPKYQDFIADFDLYLAWDEFVQGLWTELRVPLVYTRWNAGLCSSTTAAGGAYYTGFTGGDVTDETVNAVVNNQHDAVPVAFTGCNALGQALLGNCGFGAAPALCAGKMSNCVNTATGLGDIRLALGWDFLRRERGNMGIAIDVAFPAANQRKSCYKCPLYIFDASVGHQHCWAVGGVLRGQYMLWDRNEDENITMYLDARAYGVWAGKTTRLLGLNAGGASSCSTCSTGSCGTSCCNSCNNNCNSCCGSNSSTSSLFNQYLLLNKYTISGDEITWAGLERAANLLKSEVKYCKAVAEGQFTAMFQYAKGGFMGALGYNFFGRSAEKLQQCCKCNCGNYYYAIKGIAPVGEDGLGGFYSPADSNISKTGTFIAAESTAEGVAALQAAAINFCPGTCNNSVNLCVASHPQYICNTIFGNLGYNWHDVDWKPYIGVIGKVDLGSSNKALRLWGVYLKGGICF